MREKSSISKCSSSGFSVIELILVVAVIFVLSSISLFYATAHQKLYKPDEQALLITDLLQEARQRSLTQRETMRVEINRDANSVTLIDENTTMNGGLPDDVDNDQIVRSIRLLTSDQVTVGSAPGQIGYNPPEPTPVDTCVFNISVYPTSIAQSVCTIRFRPFSGESGQAAIVDAGTNPLGTDANPISVTIHVWSPSTATPTNSDISRAITIIGATASIRLWEFDENLTTTNKWKNSRRGGGTY
ncbi:MAG: hypothetical protein H7070_12985 [Saprospiraceae bacterium]|nr:hypothetical protein [Pyrinomonadaceae bacterium]